MAKLTWLGEDELHNTVDAEGNVNEGAGPSFTIWNKIKFPKGHQVDVNDPGMIEKARNNPFFQVEDGEMKRGPGRPKKQLEEVDGGHENAL